MTFLCREHDKVGSWVMERCEGEWYPGRGTTLGWLDSKGNIVAGAIFEHYNGTHLWMHFAARPNSVTEEFLHACFHFAFVENHCQRISSLVEESNEACKRFVRRLGATEVGRIEGAGFNGGSLLVYQMKAQECKWLSEDYQNGK